MNVHDVLSRLKLERFNEMQQASISAAEAGKDVVLLAPTGSGKTLAFLIPVLQRLQPGQSHLQCLILVPSRELALQIEGVFKQMTTTYKVTCCYGGHPVKTELNNLKQTPAVLIGTPGRVAFHLRNANFDPALLSILVLDEFDKSLTLGFADDMTAIIAPIPGAAQRLLTSATSMPQIPAFTGIQTDAAILDFLNQERDSPNYTLKSVPYERSNHFETLYKLICKIGDEAILIFCNTRERVEEISEFLIDKDLIHDIFHGGLQQDERERALVKFRNGSVRVLVATDLAARGLDIIALDHIIHFELPETAAVFTHRNGRTARMQAEGLVFLMTRAGQSVDFIPEGIAQLELGGEYQPPVDSIWKTLYISVGKKDKVNKVDILGFLLQRGGLQKSDVGLIEVKDHASFVAVKRSLSTKLLDKLNGNRLKNKKIKIEAAL